MTKEYQENKSNLQEKTSEVFVDKADQGYKFLSDALRGSFFLLKIIMLVLFVFFLISGFETIGHDEKALVLRFGKIKGLGEERVLGSGLTWVWPYPIDEIIKIPVAKKINLAIDSFWYYQSPKEKLQGGKGNFDDVLRPVRDGYSLTRSKTGSIATSGEIDYNIVHTKWQLTYQIKDPESFFKNVYVDLGDIEAGQNYSDLITKNITPILENLVADAVIATLVNYTIDDVLFDQIAAITGHVKKLLQKKLNGIDSGIKVISIQMDDKTWPRQIDGAFWASIRAHNIKGTTISEAKTYAEKTFNEAKGLEAQAIAQAKAYRRTTIETAKAKADYFNQLLVEYRKRPRLVVDRIYQDTIREVLENADEKMILQPTDGAKGKEIRIIISRDPTIKGKRK